MEIHEGKDLVHSGQSSFFLFGKLAQDYKGYLVPCKKEFRAGCSAGNSPWKCCLCRVAVILPFFEPSAWWSLNTEEQWQQPAPSLEVESSWNKLRWLYTFGSVKKKKRHFAMLGLEIRVNFLWVFLAAFLLFFRTKLGLFPAPHLPLTPCTGTVSSRRWKKKSGLWL